MTTLIKINPADESIIGKRLRLPDWDTCYMLIKDVGHHYVIGTIFERNQAIVNEARPIHANWLEYNGPLAVGDSQ